MKRTLLRRRKTTEERNTTTTTTTNKTTNNNNLRTSTNKKHEHEPNRTQTRQVDDNNLRRSWPEPKTSSYYFSNIFIFLQEPCTHSLPVAAAKLHRKYRHRDEERLLVKSNRTPWVLLLLPNEYTAFTFHTRVPPPTTPIRTLYATNAPPNW